MSRLDKVLVEPVMMKFDTGGPEMGFLKLKLSSRVKFEILECWALTKLHKIFHFLQELNSVLNTLLKVAE